MSIIPIAEAHLKDFRSIFEAFLKDFPHYGILYFLYIHPRYQKGRARWLKNVDLFMDKVNLREDFMRLRFVTITALLGIVVLGLVSLAGAGTTTGSLSVSATVSNNCQITNTPSIAFGNYDPLSVTPVDATGTISLACTKGAVAVISLDSGANSANATGTTRAMKDAGTDFLNYELYSNSGRTTVWTASPGVTEPAAPSKAPVNYTVYGRIPAGQDQPANAYSDTVGITVNF